MKALLLTLVDELKAMGDFGDRVFITEAQELVPPELKTPAAGIKDGDLDSEDLTAGCQRETLEAHVFVYAEARRPGQALLGNTSANKAGVLDLADAVRQRLHGNLLGLEADGIISARVKEVGESISWEEKARIMTSKYLTLVYEREN